MIREDQTDRLVARMSELSAQLASLKKERQYNEAVDQINDTLHSDLGLSPLFVKSISEHDLVAMVRSNLMSLDRALVLAKLLTERAELNWLLNEPHNGLIRTLKALLLYLEAYEKAPKHTFSEYYSDIESLAGNLGDYRLPPDAQLKLFRYYDATGRYSKAEDVLFEALENAAGRSWIEEGQRFYDRLSVKTDEDLEAGNLPREEIEESRAELARLVSRI